MTYLVGIADTHCCHRLGLCDPETELPDPVGDGTFKVELTETQRYLWQEYNKFTEYVAKVAGNNPVILVLLGDWMHGNKYPEQLMSNRISDQIDIAIDTVKPWITAFKKVKAVRVFQGTSAHDPVGALTINATKRLCGEYPRLDIGIALHELMTVNGVLFDMTHPGAHPGSRKWLEGNMSRYDLRSMMLDDIAHGVEPARCYLRAHRHEYRHEQVEIYGVPDRIADIWSLPSMCGISYHAKQADGKRYRLENGMLYVEIGKGDIGKWEMKRSILDTRTKETL